MKVRVLKGGWVWKGVTTHVNDVLDAPSEQWVANRVADGGLVEPIADDDPPAETAAIEAPETATVPSARSRKKG